MSNTNPTETKPSESLRIRIAWFITSLESGGSERQLAALLEGLPSERYEKHVICLSGYGIMEESVRSSCEQLYDLKYPRLRVNGRIQWARIPSMLATVPRLAVLLRKIQPDILHTLIPICNIMGALGTVGLSDIKMIASRLSLGNYRDSSRILRYFEDRTDKRFDMIHCKSEGIREDVLRREPVPRERTRVIYNGIRVERYGQANDGTLAHFREKLGLSDSHLVIGMVANLKPYKGHLDMIRAMPAIVRNHSNTLLLCIGRDDGIGNDLRDEARRLGVTDHIILAGERDDVPQLMQLMTVLVSASHEEGFSNVILEAMASALPVVATTVGGNVEQIDHEITGILVPPGQPELLAEAVTALLQDTAKRESMGNAGANRVSELFSYRSMINGMDQIYRELLEDRTR